MNNLGTTILRDGGRGFAGPRGSASFVRLFKPQFAALVESGEKRQTIRPTPKRMPMTGDKISLRAWTGKPYRSKQRVLREAIVSEVHPVRIDKVSFNLDGLWLSTDSENLLAKLDGFKDATEMRAWFAETHGLPFEGVLICWQNAEIIGRAANGD